VALWCLGKAHLAVLDLQFLSQVAQRGATLLHTNLDFPTLSEQPFAIGRLSPGFSGISADHWGLTGNSPPWLFSIFLASLGISCSYSASNEHPNVAEQKKF